ncbi:MAG: YihY/virulence factor BrkB family protein [Bacteroidetes bacterium]|nr:YihY/virulence factor BrkB family protein [Bacteroidota bacterium]
MKKIWYRLKIKYPVLVDWEERSLCITVPGLDGIPVYDVYRFFIAEIRSNSLPTRSKAIAFSFFLAIFPALTFVFTLMPYLPYFRDLDVVVLNFLRQVLPNQESYIFIKNFIEPLLTDLAKHKRGGLLTGSFILVLFLTSEGVIAMMSSFDKSYDYYKKRNAIQTRLVAFKITLLLTLLFISSISLIVLGRTLFNFLFSMMPLDGSINEVLFGILRYALILIMFFVGISLIYYYGPATKTKYKFISTGATVATILSIFVSVGFSYYVANFSKLNVIFGSIGTIMLLMIWLNINSFILLVGYEINVSIHYNKRLRTRELEIKEESEPVL